MYTRDLKTELQSYGLRLPTGSLRGRKGGAGPAEGATFLMGNTVVNVPFFSGYVQHSPYWLSRRGDSSYDLWYNDYRVEKMLPLAPAPDFYHKKTGDGFSYEKIALIHGKDCLASTVLQDCYYQGLNAGCSFCAIKLSLQREVTIRRKEPQQLEEVARESLREGITHLLLTTGTLLHRKEELRHLSECVKALKEATGLPIQVQCLPPEDFGLLEILKEAGVDTLGLHIESLDENVLQQHAPAKASLGWKGFQKVWSRAVKLWGRGQVTSYIIMGLGENLPRSLERIEKMVELGVYPYVVPLRPVQGTKLENKLPPSPSLMKQVYEFTAGLLSAGEMCAGEIAAGCGRCRACSALPDFEDVVKERPQTTCRPIDSKEEKEKAMALRRQVFVEEQGLFADTDEDEYDRRALHLVARCNNRLIGTVRLYHLEEGIWMGGRLAVSPDYRHNGIAPLLVKKAVELAHKNGASKFMAWVQDQHKQFFLHLGWWYTGNKKLIAGKEHLLMQAF